MSNIVPAEENKVATQNEPGIVKHNVKGKMYSAGGKSEPDAWLAQKWANDRGVCTEIVQAEQTKDYVQVITRAIRPKTGQYVEDIIRHDFNTIFLKKAIDLVDKSLKNARSGQKKTIFIEDLNEPLIMTDEGEMVPNLTSRGKIKILKEMINFKNFAIRDATSKSMRRASLKILNYDWREDEEVEMENEEIETVNKMIKKNKKTSNKEKVKQDDDTKYADYGFNPDKYEEQEYIPPEKTETKVNKKYDDKLAERREEIKNSEGNIQNEEKKGSKRKNKKGNKSNEAKQTNNTEKIDNETKDLPDDELKINILLNTIKDNVIEKEQEFTPLNMLRTADSFFKEDRITMEQFRRVKDRIKEGTYDV